MMLRLIIALCCLSGAAAVEVITFAADATASQTNSHLLLGRDHAVLIDVPMTRTAATCWLAELPRHLGTRQLTLIHLTDSHPDHGGSLPEFRRRFPAVPITARAAVAEDIRRDGPLYHGRLRARLGDEIDPALLIPDPHLGDHIDLDGGRLDLIAFDGGHSLHQTAIVLPGGRLLSCELVYPGFHPFLRERRLAGWRANLDQLDALMQERGITTLIPSHGAPCTAAAIAAQRAYFDAFERAVALGSREDAERAMRTAFPGYAMEAFLTAYTLPAYFPTSAAGH